MNYFNKLINGVKDVKKIILISAVLNRNYDLLEECGLSRTESEQIYEVLKDKLKIQIDEFYEVQKNEEESLIENYFHRKYEKYFSHY